LAKNLYHLKHCDCQALLA